MHVNVIQAEPFRPVARDRIVFGVLSEVDRRADVRKRAFARASVGLHGQKQVGEDLLGHQVALARLDTHANSVNALEIVAAYGPRELHAALAA